MPNVIDYLNEEGTRELIRWTNEVSKEWEKSFEDLSIEEVEDAFKDLDESDPLYSPLQQAIEEAKAAAAKVDNLTDATETKSGLMSSADKKHLDSINDYTTGENLIRGSRDFRLGTDNSFSGQFCTDGFFEATNTTVTRTITESDDGFPQFNISCTNGSASAAKGRYTNYFPAKKGDTFTLSFEFMVHSDIALNDNNIIRIAHLGSSAVIGTDNVSIATLCPEAASYQKDTWYKAKYTFSISSDAQAYVTVAFQIWGTSGHVSFRKPMIQYGAIDNPLYASNPNDVDFIDDVTTGINLLRGTRDLTKGTTGIMGSSSLFTDGSTYESVFTLAKDDDGFTYAKGTQSGLSANATKVVSLSVIQNVSF